MSNTTKLILFVLSLSLCLFDSHAATPAGYVEQPLNEVNGHILRPTGWFYSVEKAGNTLVYRITKEDSSKDNFLTGLSISVIPNVSKCSRIEEKGGKTQDTGKLTAKSAADAYMILAKGSSKEISRATSEDKGFVRNEVLLEKTLKTQEKDQQFKLSIATLASVKDDLLIVMTFGTPSAEWDTNKDIYQTICSSFVFSQTNLVGTVEQASMYHSPIVPQDYVTSWRTYNPQDIEVGSEPSIQSVKILTDPETLEQNVNVTKLAEYLKALETITLNIAKNEPEHSFVMVQCTLRTNGLPAIATIGNINSEVGAQLHQALATVPAPNTHSTNCSFDVIINVGQPTIYSVFDGAQNAKFELTRNAITNACRLIETRSLNHVYCKSVPIATPIPARILLHNKELIGTALVAYQIQTNGSPGIIRVVKCSNPDLREPLEDVVRGFTFKPATLDGKVISTVDTQQFDYTAASKP